MHEETNEMAIDGAIRVAFEDVFPHGAYASGDVKEARDWEKSTRKNHVQQRVQAMDPETGELVEELPVWLVTVHDGDPEATQTMTVQVVSRHQPVLPAPVMGPFRPIELGGLAMEIYVNKDKCRGPREGESHQCRGKPAFKFWASEIRPANGATAVAEAS